MIRVWRAPKPTEAKVDLLRAEVARLRDGLRRIQSQDYDAGYSAEDYADAVLSGHEPQKE